MIELNRIYCMDCLDGMKQLDNDSIDLILTDPPYELGFMGKEWDKSGIAYNVDLWREVLRVLKPGGHLLSFGGSRTYHRMACAIEDAGFEIRDQILWVYGQGFPKSMDISKAIDKMKGATREVIGVDESKLRPNRKSESEGGERVLAGGFKSDNGATITAPATPEAQEWHGWGTALKPAVEPIVLARKPLSEKTVAENILKWGVGGLNIDGTRIPTNPDVDDPRLGGNGNWSSDKMAKNVYEGGYAGKRVGSSSLGRFPSNLIHDGSDEVLAEFAKAGESTSRIGKPRGTFKKGLFANSEFNKVGTEHNDSGTPARFFYCAKASRSERETGLDGMQAQSIAQEYGLRTSVDKRVGRSQGDRTNTPRCNNHPTVKPLALMEYLIKLASREGQVVLDPFGGSGTTALAAKRLGRNYILFELEQNYVDITNKRLSQKTLREVSE